MAFIFAASSVPDAVRFPAAISDKLGALDRLRARSARSAAARSRAAASAASPARRASPRSCWRRCTALSDEVHQMFVPGPHADRSTSSPTPPAQRSASPRRCSRSSAARSASRLRSRSTYVDRYTPGHVSLDHFENILVERDGAVAIVTINRPKVLNALSTQTLDELRRAMLALQARRRRCARRDPHRRRREVVRRRRRHQRAGGADAGQRPRARAARPARVRSDRAPGQAGDRRDQRLRARRRLRAGDGVHDPDRRRHARSSASRRSTSGSFPATPGRSACRGSSAAAARSSCC